MKKLILFLIPVLLFSCKKDPNAPQVETTTVGIKWNLRIGSPAAEVYASLQQLGTEKDFTDVAVVRQGLASKPEEIRDRFLFYRAISVETTTGVLDRAYIELGTDKVTAVQIGSALPSPTAKWPLDVPDAIAIHYNDPLNTIYDKLLAIYQVPKYADRKIGFSDKPLNKAFDPNMVNYDEWSFSFFANVPPSRSGRSTVQLYFKNGKLNKIVTTYQEFDVYI